MSLFEARKVTKMFGGLTAVSNVDFNIEKGMIAGLIGPNGAGKTTFFNGMTGVYHITSGEMLFDGKNIVLCHFILLAACANDREHESNLCNSSLFRNRSGCRGKGAIY